jgi:hypothetical protein
MKKYGREKGIVEMREMYKSTYLELKRVRIILKNKDNRIKELRDKHKKKEKLLSWRYWRMSQIAYGKQKEVDKIRSKRKEQYTAWRMTGYREAMRKVKRQNFRVKGLSRFMFHMAEVVKIYDLTLEEYSFIMWAGMYDYFDRKDFLISNKGANVQFYVMIRKMINKGYAVIVGEKTGETRKVFALTGVGYDLYNRIAKFTNKFLIDAGTSDIRNNLQDTSGS